MPIYEYLCKKCDIVDEITWDKFDGGPIVYCKICNKMMHKILSRVYHKNKNKGKP